MPADDGLINETKTPGKGLQITKTAKNVLCLGAVLRRKDGRG